MKERNVTVTLDKAKEWFNSGNATLKEIALQAFSEEELTWHYSQIKTLEDACKALGLNYDIISIVTKDVASYSRASAAMFKLNIIRKALNLGQDLYLTKCAKGSCLYYPYNPFVNENSIYYRDVVNSNRMEIIGRIKSEGKEYNVLGGEACNSGSTGLGNLTCSINIGTASIGFLSCATEEIAKHFGKYFGMLITEAKYADMVNFEIIENKYAQ